MIILIINSYSKKKDSTKEEGHHQINKNDEIGHSIFKLGKAPF